MADNSVTKPLYNKSAGQISPISAPRSQQPEVDIPAEAGLGTQTVPTAEYSASNLRVEQAFTANQPGMPIDEEGQSTRRQSKREENKAGGIAGGILPPALTVPFVASVIIVALLIDFVEIWVLGLLGFFTAPIAGLFFWYMFKRQGINMQSRSRLIILILGPLANILPGFSLIPGGWTAEVIAIIVSVYTEQKILKKDPVIDIRK